VLIVVDAVLGARDADLAQEIENIFFVQRGHAQEDDRGRGAKRKGGSR